MKPKHIIIYILLILAVNQNSYAQGLHSTSAKAVKSYNVGMQAYDYLDYNKAEFFFKEAASLDKYFFEAFLMLGEVYSKKGRHAEAADNYRTAIRLDSNAYKPVYFSVANAELLSGDYENALIHYNAYLRIKGVSEVNKAKTLQNIRNCRFAIEAIKNPVSFNPVNIGSKINTKDDEYWPSITADDQILMFTRQPVVAGGYSFGVSRPHEDFYISRFSGTEWTTAVNAGAPLNTSQNEGAQTLSSGGNYMYFTACSRQGGMGSCDIYFSAFIDGRWSKPQNLGPPVNTSAWESTPSISADGNMLIFSSNRPGGFGGKDLWYSVLNDKGVWSQPVNLGKSINTPNDEMSPFLHFDGKSLYFASDGRPGMGGFDIYLSRMNADTTWNEPVNLGYPINTYTDETGLVIDATGKKAYFSSKRDAENGKDIFHFELYESVRPDPVSYLKGKVVDRETGALLKAEYVLINLTNNTLSVKNNTDDEGNFLVCLPAGFNYGINITKQGYLFHSESFMFEGVHPVSKPLLKIIALSKIKVGEKMVLANVFYEIDSWELKKESLKELNTLADLLNNNKELVLEIGGYTDSTGSDAHNLVLSEKRANSVVEYLISKGIAGGRLIPKGYGNSSPVGDNLTIEGRKMNRRTEAKIVGTK
jgi:hypothetical protein